jgi:superfamily II DNA/RNA helicase
MTSSEIKEFNNWDDYEMDDDVLRGIYAYGYEKPSPIQKRAIQPLMDKKDIIAQAQSGTGKTGAFTIGVLNKINVKDFSVQAMILSPTRELSIQSMDVIKTIGSYVKGLRVQLLVGGTSTFEDIQLLEKNTPHIIVGCPGRTYDMIKRGYINTETLNLFILDEADELLSFGFKEQIYNIFQYLSPNCQIGLFSATMPPDVTTLSNKFMREPLSILVKSEMLTLEGISQFYIALESDSMKFSTLKDLYSTLSISQCIIYCNSVKRVEDLYEAMMEDSFSVSRIHSNMDKHDRELAYRDFKSGKNRILISSNVTARGIDIQQVSTVINFDIPKDHHTYLHRIGRSGRWGRKGTSINFVTKYDMKTLKLLEQYYNIEIKELPATFVKQE